MSTTTMTPAQAKIAAFISTLTETQIVEAITGVSELPGMGPIHAQLVTELEARFPKTAAAAWDVIFADTTDTLGFADALRAVKA